MAEFKLGYKHYPKDLNKFGYIDKQDSLTNLRFGNDTLIELGRTRSHFDRTTDVFVGLFGCSAFIFMIIIGIKLLCKLSVYNPNGEMFLSLGLILLSLFGLTLPLSQVIKAIFWPADYPVRFNRKTGKVYIYEPQLSKRNFYFPLREIVRLYKPVIKVYDWQDIEGMVTRKGFAFQQVFFAAVIDRQADRIIDHFGLWDSANFFNNEEWRWLLSYMDGMQGLNYKGKIRGRFWLGRLCNCFAPEFYWPEGIDKASQAESLDELAKIEQQYNLTGKRYPYQQP